MLTITIATLLVTTWTLLVATLLTRLVAALLTGLVAALLTGLVAALLTGLVAALLVITLIVVTGTIGTLAALQSGSEALGTEATLIIILLVSRISSLCVYAGALWASAGTIVS